jgi:cytochrome c biogenesis protein CcdA
MPLYTMVRDDSEPGGTIDPGKLVAGLAAVYAILGAIVAAVGGTFGSIMGNGPVLYAIAMYYLIMGLFLMDVFHMPTPLFFSKLHAKSANSQGIAGA